MTPEVILEEIKKLSEKDFAKIWPAIQAHAEELTNSPKTMVNHMLQNAPRICFDDNSEVGQEQPTALLRFGEVYNPDPSVIIPVLDFIHNNPHNIYHPILRVFLDHLIGIHKHRHSYKDEELRIAKKHLKNIWNVFLDSLEKHTIPEGALFAEFDNQNLLSEATPDMIPNGVKNQDPKDWVYKETYAVKWIHATLEIMRKDNQYRNKNSNSNKMQYLELKLKEKAIKDCSGSKELNLTPDQIMQWELSTPGIRKDYDWINRIMKFVKDTPKNSLKRMLFDDFINQFIRYERRLSAASESTLTRRKNALKEMDSEQLLEVKKSLSMYGDLGIKTSALRGTMSLLGFNSDDKDLDNYRVINCETLNASFNKKLKTSYLKDPSSRTQMHPINSQSSREIKRYTIKRGETYLVDVPTSPWRK